MKKSLFWDFLHIMLLNAYYKGRNFHKRKCSRMAGQKTANFAGDCLSWISQNLFSRWTDLKSYGGECASRVIIMKYFLYLLKYIFFHLNQDVFQLNYHLVQMKASLHSYVTKPWYCLPFSVLVVQLLGRKET